MPEGGHLWIRSHFFENGGKAYAKLSITDTGIGISEENLQRIQEPFFTTKTMGTDLGLAVCKKTIQAHRGTMTIKSKEGEGTTVEFTLPVQEA